MKPSKAEKIRSEILSIIQDIDICGYLAQEVESFLNYLHYYKLKNVLDNSDLLIEYLMGLDKQNTQQILELLKNDQTQEEQEEEQEEKLPEAAPNFSYYLSNSGQEEIDEEEFTCYINNHLNTLQTVMLGVKGLFLLTSNEFCHASSTRMWINQRNWKKDMEKKQALKAETATS